jgi:hypothetical protein
MTKSAKQNKSTVVSFATAALMDSTRAIQELAAVTVLISISLVVTKDST